MRQDPEIYAMNNVLSAMNDLNNWQRKRIIDWVTARFQLDEPEHFSPESEVTVPVQSGEPESMVTAESRMEDYISHISTGGKQLAPTDPAKKKKRSIADFDTALNLFSEANVKKNYAKVILMIAFLQARLGKEDVTSYEISSKLKRIGFDVPYITSAINTILKKNPPLMVISSKSSDNKQARRKFQLTPDGFKLANSFLK